MRHLEQFTINEQVSVIEGRQQQEGNLNETLGGETSQEDFSSETLQGRRWDREALGKGKEFDKPTGA